MSDARSSWSEFLNPETVRSKLISAGLFLVAHEMLLDAILRHPRSFFSDTFTADRGQIPSATYAREVLSLDPKGKNDPLRGSIAWWQKNDVLNDSDIQAIRRVTDARNEIAHEMSSLVGGTKQPSFMIHFDAVMSLANKIEKWWIINFEIATDPDWDGKEVSEGDVIPSTAWMMDILTQVALGEGQKAWELYDQFAASWPAKAS